MKSDRSIIIHHEKGAWWGRAYTSGWSITTPPQPSEVEALIVALSMFECS
jgi:hypothetical protein